MSGPKICVDNNSHPTRPTAILTLYLGHVYYIVNSHLEIIEEQNPIVAFSYALKAPETKRQYPRRFKMFVDFLKLEGPLEEQAKQFLLKARENQQ
jgi:hypothetical protein